MMSFFKSLALLLFIFVFWTGFPIRSSATDERLKDVVSTIERYKKDGLKVDVKRQTILKVLGDGKVDLGTLKLFQNRLRMELRPDPNPLKETIKMVVDGQSFWNVQEVEGWSPHVSRARLTGLKSALYNLFLGHQSWFDSFSTIRSTRLGDSTRLELEPEKPDEFALKALKIVLKGKGPFELAVLSFVDDLENETIYEFFEPKSGGLTLEEFEYIPPKNVKVSDIDV